ncbi:S8 family serine peptidase [Pilimelia columellifera subsp. columellifera]|uniref:S8 family serine peptidase n=1 Tax=Pilimelia columellifera subsp. columellifera TaxID=706583 RepID=A0ABN3NF52_9ACTN
MGTALAVIAVGVWTVSVLWIGQSAIWVTDQAQLATGVSTRWLWPVSGVASAALIILPALLLALVPRAPWARATGRVWLLGAAVLGGLSLTRAFPPHAAELQLLASAALAALGALALRARPSVPPPTPPSPPAASASASAPADRDASWWPGLAAGALMVTPWLWLGAFGGIVETLAAALAAAALGWLCAGLLRPVWPHFAPGGGARRVLLGGLVAGIALLLVGAGVGLPGPHLATMAALSALGFAAAALAGRGVGPLVAATTFGPLALVDNEEMTLLLLGRDVPLWTLVAALVSLPLAWLLGGVLWLAGRPAPAGGPGWAPAWGSSRRLGAVTTAIVLVASGAGVHLAAGQPGLHGERLFVILDDQASLVGLPAGPAGAAGHPTRVRAVYDRLVAHADRTQRDLRRELDGKRLAHTPYYLVNAIEVDAGPALRPWLESLPGVDRVLLSPRLRPLPAPVGTARGDRTAPTGPTWNLRMINADRVWNEFGVRGRGIVVGTSDSGVDGAHPTLAGGFRGGDDSWRDPWNDSRFPQDHAGHGTHTLATAVGRGGVGVAPDAAWVGCVNLDRNLGNPALYLDCLQFLLAPFPPGADPLRDGRPDRAPHVLTNSWGCPPLEGCDRQALAPAVAAFTAAGVFFVAAAGNSGPRCGSISDPPAPYRDALSVAAVDRGREVTDFSSRGGPGSGKPDLAAPGSDVVSAMPGGGYASQDGTSMAAPHVAGVVALLWSAQPSLIGDLARTRAILTGTAAPILVPPGANTCGDQARLTGAGLVDAHAAVRAARGQ